MVRSGWSATEGSEVGRTKHSGASPKKKKKKKIREEKKKKSTRLTWTAAKMLFLQPLTLSKAAVTQKVGCAHRCTHSSKPD